MTDDAMPAEPDPVFSDTVTAGVQSWRYNVTDPTGAMAATVDSSGAVLLDLADLHGSIIATTTVGGSGITAGSYSESSEYGAPRTPGETLTSTTNNYGWLGTHQRSDNSYGGLILMGARLYNPTTARFLTHFVRKHWKSHRDHHGASRAAVHSGCRCGCRRRRGRGSCRRCDHWLP